MCQTRACHFKTELTAAVGEGMSVGVDIFGGSNVDPVRLRNAHITWKTAINSYCKGIALEIVQRSEAPHDTCQNLKPHYRAKGTREILHLISHDVNGKTIEPGGDSFKLMMEIGRFAADLRRLGDKSVPGPSKCVIIVVGLSADYKIECRMLENNPADLNKTKIERVVGNQHNRRLRQQQESKLCWHRKAPPRQIAARGGTADPATNTRVTALVVERKITALKNARAQRRSKNPEMPPLTRRVKVGANAMSVEVRSTLRTSTVA